MLYVLGTVIQYLIVVRVINCQINQVYLHTVVFTVIIVYEY